MQDDFQNQLKLLLFLSLKLLSIIETPFLIILQLFQFCSDFNFTAHSPFLQKKKNDRTVRCGIKIIYLIVQSSK